MTDLKAAVFTVLEGWALPLDARKILETAYYAQPEQELVCDKDPHLCGFVQCQLGKVCKNTIVGQFVGGIPEVSQQREWVGLTGREIEVVLINSGYTAESFARAIEAKLKEKNT